MRTNGRHIFVIFTMMLMVWALPAAAQVPSPSQWKGYPPLNTLNGHSFFSVLTSKASPEQLKTYLPNVSSDIFNCNFSPVQDRWRKEVSGYTQNWYYTSAQCKHPVSGPYQVLYAFRTSRVNWANVDHTPSFAYCISFVGRSPAVSSWSKISGYQGPANIECIGAKTMDALILVTDRGSNQNNGGNNNYRQPRCRTIQPPERYYPDGTIFIPPPYQQCD
jgi:hypothetical protein